MSQPRLLLLTFSALVCTLLPHTGHAYTGDFWCRNFDMPLVDGSSTKVYIHPDLAGLMKHGDGSSWTNAELQHEVEFVLERIMDYAPSNMPPLKFAGLEAAGTSYGGPDYPSSNTIAFRPNVHGCGSHAYPHPASEGTIIHMSTLQTPTCNTQWEHWAGHIPNSPTLGGVLLHETMHALGLGHQQDCNTPELTCSDSPGEQASCGTMQTHGWSSEYLYPQEADRDALQTLYGPWANDGRYRRESSDASSWSSIGSGPIASRPLTRSDWSQGSTLLPVGMQNVSGDPQLFRWQRSGDTYSDWGVPYTYNRQLGPVGVAVSYGKRYLSFIRGQAQNAVNKYLRYSSHTSSSASSVVWLTEAAGRPGHDISWDLKNNRLIHVWRTIENEIVLGVSNGTSGFEFVSAPLSGAYFKAGTAPSISCGPSTVDKNCMLVWASDGENSESYRRLNYTQFRMFWDASISDWNFDFGSQYTSGYIQFGAPSVTYHGPENSSQAFIVAWKNPGRCYYTMRKGKNNSNTFSGIKSHCSHTGSHNGPPMLGSTSGPWAEAWAWYNDD